MKSLRQEKILEIIAQRDIETQHSLADALKEMGLESTQATISRDIRELGLTKEPGPGGGYRYAAPRRSAVPGYDERLKTIFKESITQVDAAQNIVVVKTLPGLASAACAAIDSTGYPGLIGTIAGDDTAFLAMEDTAAARLLQAELAGVL